MNLQDAVAVPWMAKFTRNSWPKKVVWVQDDVTHSRFYWLSVDGTQAKGGDEFIAEIKDQNIEVLKGGSQDFRLLLNDACMNLDQPIVVKMPDGKTSEHHATRTIAAICESLLDRNDPASAYSATIDMKANSEGQICEPKIVRDSSERRK